MGGKRLVSSIMIFLNEEKFIQEAIDSAIAETYKHWELLLVDDGSDDRSTEIAHSYARRYPRKVRYLEHDNHRNLGMSASRNLGISNARGDFLAFLDADDVWLPTKLEQQVAIMDSQPTAALVCGRAQWWYSWTGKPEDLQRDFLQEVDVELDSLVQPPKLITVFLQNEWASLCDILVRREAVQQSGGYENFFRGMYEDQAFHTKLLLRFPVFVSSHCWYRYRQHPEACTALSHKSGETYIARQTFLRWLERYLSQQQVKDADLWKVIEKETWSFRHPTLASLRTRLGQLKNRMYQTALRVKHPRS